MIVLSRAWFRSQRVNFVFLSMMQLQARSDRSVWWPWPVFLYFLYFCIFFLQFCIFVFLRVRSDRSVWCRVTPGNEIEAPFQGSTQPPNWCKTISLKTISAKLFLKITYFYETVTAKLFSKAVPKKHQYLSIFFLRRSGDGQVFKKL